MNAVWPCDNAVKKGSEMEHQEAVQMTRGAERYPILDLESEIRGDVYFKC